MYDIACVLVKHLKVNDTNRDAYIFIVNKETRILHVLLCYECVAVS